MSSKRYLSAKEAAEALNISVSTLYAYVSRGLIRSEQASEGKRQRRYYAEDVEKLLARKEGRRNPEKLAQDALHWGAPVLDSAITLIDNGKLYYRGRDVSELARQHSVEEVAALIWTGNMDNAAQLFDLDGQVSAQRYETMLLHLGMDGAQLTPLQELQTFLPAAAADDLAAYDLRPATVALTGARILRLMTSVVAGEVPENIPLATMLQRGWAAQDESTRALFSAALIIMADHELNASSFTARVVASVRSTPYAVVLGGLTALQGSRHGGTGEQVEALFREARSSDNMQAVLTGRLRRGESIPGFGHRLYPEYDPRAHILIDLLHETYPASPEVAFGRELSETAQAVLGEAPNVDFALALLALVLDLPPGSPLTIFALGRTIGWIGHAIEQYQQDRMIRPRARYTGEHPA